MFDFKNKQVTVMGLGLYEDGSGISATRFLVERGARVTVTDLKSKEQLAQQIERLQKRVETGHAPSLRSGFKIHPIEFVLGRHRESDFQGVDLIVKNPGVPRASKYLQIARAKGIPIETDISLFFQLVPRKRIIGITGTRGKSTTTTLIYEMISAVDKKTVLGGNILKSPLTQLAKMKNGGVAVLELSSWMLEGLADRRLSPHISVFTNIYPDHLNTYDDLEDYASAKENIFLWQNLQDYTVLNRDNKYTRRMGNRVPSQRFWFSLREFKEENGAFVRRENIFFRIDGREQKMLSVSDIKIIGEHNLANVLAAVCVAGICGVKPAIIRQIIKKFSGVPNRLELLRELKGVKYYNDTTSTTPEATIAALKALSPLSVPRTCLSGRQGRGSGSQIILIAGGADKGLDFKELAQEINKYCRTIILLNGTGADKIHERLRVIRYPLYVTRANSMAEAVGVARSFAKRGDIILLSPACASFGMFVNEFDRGDQFRKIIKGLKQ